MFLEILALIVVGVLFGIVTGLTPGVHINLVSAILVTISPFLLKFLDPFSLVMFVIAMAITHSFLDFIPSVFLGVPEPETAVSVMPAHRMLLEGQGFEAVKLTAIGSLLAVICCIALMPLLIIVMPLLYGKISKFIGYILIIAVLFIIFREKTWDKKFWAFFVFSMAGILGVLALNFPSLNEPLFPLLSGMFGISMLVTSLQNNAVIPKQRTTEHIVVSKKLMSASTASGTVAGALVGLLPGLGPAQATIIGSLFVGGIETIGTVGYLMMQGSINVVNFVVSVATFFTIDKVRNGAVVAVQQIIGKISLSQMLMILAGTLLVAGIATFLTVKIVRIFSKIVEKLNYKLLSLSIIALIVVLCIVLSGFVGLLVLAVSTAIGIIPIVLGIEKNHSMGCILLPVIFYFVL